MAFQGVKDKQEFQERTEKQANLELQAHPVLREPLEPPVALALLVPLGHLALMEFPGHQGFPVLLALFLPVTMPLTRLQAHLKL